MHRKSLEAAEHIRKQDEIEFMNGENSSCSSSNGNSSSNCSQRNESGRVQVEASDEVVTCRTPPPSSPMPSRSPSSKAAVASKKPNSNAVSIDLKSKSVANLRAKAKEHSAKLLSDIIYVNGADVKSEKESNNARFPATASAADLNEINT